jgi:hypothetical protein
MIELKSDRLQFRFPEVHPEAELAIDFQRTLRIPDDEREYPLPPGLGRFPLRLVDDFTARVPETWRRHGGVMLPMYQSEALWLLFAPHRDHRRASAYPFAVKVGAGKINALTGESWTAGLDAGRGYVVASVQPWLDGYCVEKGVIRQFVAMPLGAGYTAEEQLSGAAEHGGLQLEVFPMKREAYERRFPLTAVSLGRTEMFAPAVLAVQESSFDMGLAPGGRMRQQVYEDRFDFEDWDLQHSARCFVHIANSLVWRAITGVEPPFPPRTAEEYTRYGLPWFEYYDDTAPAMEGSEVLAKMKSVAAKGAADGSKPLPENAPVDPVKVVRLGRSIVREGSF